MKLKDQGSITWELQNNSTDFDIQCKCEIL